MQHRIYYAAIKYAPIRVTIGILAALIKKLPRIAFYALSFLAIFWVGQQLYYKYAPADQFLDYYYAKVDDSPAGVDPLLTVCRHFTEGALTISAQRTFVQFVGTDNHPQTVAQYNFNANVEKTPSNCQSLRLTHQPGVVGTYKVHTEYVFYVHGNRKVGEYDSNQYKITQPVLTLDQQVTQLQDEINQLNIQLQQLKAQQNGGASSTSGVSNAAGGTTTTTTSGNSAGSSSTSTQSAPSATTTPNSAADSTSTAPETPANPPAQCAVGILGGGLFCGSDGIIRL